MAIDIMKKLLFALIVLTGCWACSEGAPTEEAVADIDTIPMLVTQIQKCAKLYSAEYQIHKIVTHDDEMKLRGTVLAHEFNITLPLGDRKIAIPMDATLKAYVDFSSFTEKSVKRRGKKIEITLPDPMVEMTSSKINHADIKKQVSILRANFSDEEMTNYEKQGRAAILNDVPKMGIVEMARENAANTLIPMLVSLGFEEKDITISFRKQFTPVDLPRLLDPQIFSR